MRVYKLCDNSSSNEDRPMIPTSHSGESACSLIGRGYCLESRPHIGFCNESLFSAKYALTVSEGRLKSKILKLIYGKVFSVVSTTETSEIYLIRA